MFTDTHAHLNHERFRDDLAAVADRARRAGVTRVVNVGYDLESSRAALQLARAHADMWATCGVHPHDAARLAPGDVEQLKALAREQRVVAIGETGLDFYRDLSPREVQARVFRALIAVALGLELPLVIHVRDAHEEALRIVEGEGAGRVGGVFHCFSGDWSAAQRCLEAGFHIGVDGPVTYPRSEELRDVVAHVPLDRLLLETDCPYLPPQSRRGKRNEPGLLPEIAQGVAEVRGLSVGAVAEATTANADGLFVLAPYNERERPATGEVRGQTLSL